jgi:hypothetical protein
VLTISLFWLLTCILTQIGFRRIARTDFFGYALNPSHASRSLQAKNDVAKPSKFLTKFPIQFILTWDILPDTSQYIRNSHSSDPESIHQRDDMGLTPIFMAVFMSNLAAVQTLLDLGVDADLRDLDNIYRWTPLVSAELISDHWVSTCSRLRNGSTEIDNR